MSGADAVIEARDISKVFPVRGASGRTLRAVDQVSFGLMRGASLGVVGESGCGKSTLARLIVQLETPTSGEVYFHGSPVAELDRRARREFRRRVQMVYQDPYSALNPRMTVFQLVGEAWEIYPELVPKQERRTEAVRLLDRVGLDHAALDRYPRSFSGGERQRICIARALATRPDVIVLDEPTSALDVSIQAQFVGLLRALQAEIGFAYVFISHDLGLVREICDEALVMYLGRVVERGPTVSLFAAPRHHYTRALISSAPVPDPAEASRQLQVALAGEVPSPIDPPSGCVFRTRCPAAAEVCAREAPPLTAAEPGHSAACYFPLTYDRAPTAAAVAQ